MDREAGLSQIFSNTANILSGSHRQGLGFGAMRANLTTNTALPRLILPATKSRDQVTSPLGLFQKVIDVLESHQLPSGEMPLLCSSNPSMKDVRYKKTVFLTAYQAALHLDIPDLRLQAITERSLAFLRRERSSSGLWRFFGKGSTIDADIDDTFAALCALRRDRQVMRDMPYLLNRLDLIQSPNGLYNTWFRASRNSSDLTVNANLLFYFSYLPDMKDLCGKLLTTLEGALMQPEVTLSRYYLSSYTLFYSLYCALRRLRPSRSQAFCLSRLTNPSVPWFVQNSKRLFYSSLAVRLVFLVSSLADSLITSFPEEQNHVQQ